jgi:hypothetical protein
MPVPQPLLIEIIKHQADAQVARYDGYTRDLFEQVVEIIELERSRPRSFVASIGDKCEALGHLIDRHEQNS